MKLGDLNSQTASTVKRVIFELFAYKRRYRTSMTIPIKLGSRTPVIINPTQKDTENNVPDDYGFSSRKWSDKKVFKQKIHSMKR